jgi:malate-CoA ligase subunit beta
VIFWESVWLRHKPVLTESRSREFMSKSPTAKRELYLGYVLDRKAERVRVIASRHGGMQIEEIAKVDPEALLQIIVDPAVGLQSFQARELAFELGLNIKQVARAVTTIMGAYRAFRDCDATMLEIAWRLRVGQRGGPLPGCCWG